MQVDPRSPSSAASADDERAIARYLYLLRTAPPDAIEQVHADAFRSLTDAQRGELLARIGQVLPPYERGLAVPANGTPIGLARLITRAEMRQPGTVARLFGPGAGIAGVAASGLLGGIAGAVVASAIAAPFLAGAAAALAAAAVPGGSPSVGTPAAADPGDPPAHELAAEAGSVDDADDVADVADADDGDPDFGLDDLFDA